MMFTTNLYLFTNVSTLSVPLHVYHGRLDYNVPGQTETNGKGIDFGVRTYHNNTLTNIGIGN